MRSRGMNRTVLPIVAAVSTIMFVAVLAFGVQVRLLSAASDTPTPVDESTTEDQSSESALQTDTRCVGDSGDAGEGDDACPEPTASPDPTGEPGELENAPTPVPGNKPRPATRSLATPALSPPATPADTVDAPGDEAGDESGGEPTDEPDDEPLDEPEGEPLGLMAAMEFAPLAVQQQTSVTAGFTATIGANRTVQFTDTSVASIPITGWQWSFGDGGTSTAQNPTHQYAADGIYTVTLVITLEDGSTASASGSVEIAGSQTQVMRCAFEMDPQGSTIPLTVNFINTSENVTSYLWNFGVSGATSTVQHPAYTYTAVGTYTVTLTCTGPLGTLTAVGQITVTESGGGEQLTAQFIASPTSGPAPLTVQVTDASLGPVASWTWSFGDGSAEVTGQGPHTHTYSSVGTYTITLTVRDSATGVSTATGVINVFAPGTRPQPSFTVVPQQGPAPLTVTVTDTSTGAIDTWRWTFGDGSAAVLGQGPHTHTYTSPGTYTIRLEVSGPGGAGAATRQVVVLPPGAEVDADFSFRITGSVPGGIEVCFTDLSEGNVASWAWNFGDGGTSTQQNPCHVYATTGNYTVTLVVTGTDTSTSSVTRIVPVVSGVQAPVAAFDVSSTNVTVGQVVRFTNRSTGEITSYAWDFGDGGTSTAENPTHTYTAVGTYIVSLIVSGPGGTSEAAQTTITVREAVLACDYSGTTTPLLNQTVTYNAQVTGLGTRTITSQSWTLHGGTVDTDGSFRITWTVPGSYTLAYTAVLSDGSDCTVTKTIQVSTETLSCSIDGASNANAYQERTFTARLTGASINDASFAWTVDGQPFGGNTRSITVIAPVGQSQYVVQVVITVGSQTCTATRTVIVNRGGADRLTCDYTGNLVPLLNETITYQGTTEFLYTRTATYQWFVNGQLVGSEQSLAHTWSTSGSHTLTLRVTPSEGAICEVSKTVTVSQQTLACEITGDFPAFVGQQATYLAGVRGLGGRTATYEWLIDGVAAGTGSTLQTIFDATGTAQLTLRVTASDNALCEASRTVTIELGQQISAIATPNAGVAPLPVTFTAQTTNIDRSTLVWHFPDGSSQHAEVGTFTFPLPGTYTITVTGTGPLGQQSASVVVRVAAANDIRAAFTPNPFGGIAPVEICFTDRSVSEGSTIISWLWDFGDGTTSTEQNPCHTYTRAGSYTVRLRVTNLADLTATASNTVNVFQVTQGASSFGFTVHPQGLVCFTSFLSDGATLDFWDFGDGATSTELNPCHTYSEEGDYTVSMWVSGVAVSRTIRVQFSGPVEPPQLAASGVCSLDGLATFTIVNSGGPMAASDTYIVTDASGTELARGMFQLGPGDSVAIQVSGIGTLTLRTVATQLSTSTVCAAGPRLSYSAMCAADGVARFTASNSGAAMPAPLSYQILGPGGAVVQSGTFQLGAGQSQTFTVSGIVGLLRLSVAGTPVIDTTCAEPGTPPPTEPPVTPPATPPATPPPGQPPLLPPPAIAQAPVCGAITEQPVAGGGAGFPLIDMNPADCLDEELPLADWTPIEIGGAVCPDWFVYHTNQTGDWEIFRYGDLPGNPDADVNLSKGIGDRIYDLGPSRSPDAGWIAFASNRDGNWEIYVGTTDGEFQQRVTRNTRAIDYDPVWSPTGERIVFESSRDGNWELYAVDVRTGVQTRLTDHPANDVNAFWSPDGRKLVFESDRDGLWQVYELDLDTLAVTRLSDGTANDQDPAYSFDGQRVAFRSDRDGANGVYVMNVDGSDVQLISDPAGRATLPVWAPDDSLLAYQSDLNGQLDIYVYEFSSGQTRRVTENAAPNYAPTWYCDAPQLILTSDVTGDANLFTTPALPIDAAPVTLINGDGVQLTTNELADQHPQNVPSEEDASRERSVIAPPRR